VILSVVSADPADDGADAGAFLLPLLVSVSEERKKILSIDIHTNEFNKSMKIKNTSSTWVRII
jgi:hypothetical protein